MLRTQIGQTSLYSPFDGVVTARLMDPGAMVTPGTPVLRVSQVNTVWVNVNVPDEDLAYVHPGTPLTFSVGQLGGRKFTGSVSTVNAVPTQGTLSYQARIREPNPDAALRGGMLVSVNIQKERHDNAIVVPRQAVAQTDQGANVFIVGPNNKAQEVPVQLGRADRYAKRSAQPAHHRRYRRDNNASRRVAKRQHGGRRRQRTARTVTVIATIVLAAAIATPRPSPAPVKNTKPAGASAPLPVPSPVAGMPQKVSLQQAIDIAAARSPVLAAARANYQLTQIPVNLARTAVFPNISAVATTSRSNNSGVSTSTGRTIGGGFTSNGINASLRQLIFDGGKVIAQIHQARAGAVAGAQTYQRALETLSFNVAQAYYSALQAQFAIAADTQVLKENQLTEQLTQAQVRAGTAPRVNLVTAHVPVVQAQVTLIRDQGNVASSLGALANQLGLDPTTLVRPVNNTPSNPASTLVPILPYDQSVARALALRPDYLAAQSSVLAAEYNVQVQHAGLYPSLSGSANYGENSTTAQGTNFVPGSSFGATLSIPIFDQGITRAQTEQAQAQLELAQSELTQTKLGVELNVQQALVSVLSNQAAVTQTQAALAGAQESLRGAQAQYRAGVTTIVLVLQAQTSLATAESDQLNAIYALRQAEQSYIYALGESSINPASR